MTTHCAGLFGSKVEAMDLVTIAGLRDNAAWRVKVNDLFPTDVDRIDEAIAARKLTLTQQEAST